MFCPNCGAGNADGAAFCASCGKGLPASPAPAAGPPPAAPAAGGTPAAAAPIPPVAPPPVPMAGPPLTPPPGGYGGGFPPNTMSAGSGAGPPPGRHLATWIIVLIVVLGLALLGALGAVAFVIVDRAHNDTTSSSSPRASASPGVSASPSTPPSSSAGPQISAEIVAEVAGAKADALSISDVESGYFLMAADSNDGHPITHVAWSPSGQYLAYVTQPKPWAMSSTLMVYDVASGATPKRVSFGSVSPKAVYGYAWVSDTELVAAAATTIPHSGRGSGTLYRVDVGAGTAEALVDTAGTILKGVDPSASADGSTLAFVNFKPSGAHQVKETLELFDMNARKLTPIAAQALDTMIDGRSFDHPLISPDGRQIFTESTGSDIGFGVTIYGSDATKVASIDYLLYPTGAAWDPSGSGKLVFGGHRKDPGPAIIFSYDPTDGSFAELVKLKAKTYLDQFAFSTDGKYLAYTALSPRHQYNTSDMTVLKLNPGSDPTIALKSFDSGWPAWTGAAAPQEALRQRGQASEAPTP